MNYSAEIISVGTEILLGNIANTDARDLSEALSELGINVFYHTVVGDNPQRLRAAVEIAKKRANIIITTGGLGPTYDDLTKETLAESFGKKLIFHQEEADKLTEYFKGRVGAAGMTPNNLRQAYLPEGCTVFSNTCGTAPGCAFEAEGIHVLMLPGPPRECRAMTAVSAIPYLRKLSDSEILSHSIRIFGMGESSVEDLLNKEMEELTNPTLAPYAKEGEVMLRVTAKAASADEAEKMMTPVIEDVRRVLGDLIYGIDCDSLEECVSALLKEKGLTLATAESCSGGLLSKRITDLAGSSEFFMGGVCTYSNEAKTNLIGVDAGIIAEKGAVSSEVAKLMASGVRERFGTDLGIGITGIAGPGGGSEEKPVGTVFVSLAAGNKVYCRSLRLGSDRSRVRTAACNHALDMIRRFVTGLEVENIEYMISSGTLLKNS